MTLKKINTDQSIYSEYITFILQLFVRRINKAIKKTNIKKSHCSVGPMYDLGLLN